MSQSYINVIGAGLAGSEAAYQIAERGIPVKLYEMRGVKSTPQHKTDNFAELVCSNSLRGDALTNAVGLLKEEMRRLGSVILESAEATRVPAGGALAVDRDGFSQMVTEKVANHPLIEVVRDEITELPTDVITVIATGPLTSDALAEKIHALNDGAGFYFYDAAAPIQDLVMENLKHLMRLCNFVRIMQLVASTILLVSRPTSNGENKSVSSK